MNELDERKIKIISILKRDKFSTYTKIALELNVSERTIRGDFKYLKTIYPQISIKRGKYEGGIYFRDDDVKIRESYKGYTNKQLYHINKMLIENFLIDRLECINDKENMECHNKDCYSCIFNRLRTNLII